MLQETKEEREQRAAEAKDKLSQKEERIHKNTEYYSEGVENPNSIAAKAAMVQRYNERQENNKRNNKKS